MKEGSLLAQDQLVVSLQATEALFAERNGK